MAMRTLRELRDRLAEQGLPLATPAIALIDVSREREVIIRSSIKELPEALAAAGVSGPCLVLFGEALRPALKS